MYRYSTKRRRKPVKIFVVIAVLFVGLSVAAFFYGKSLLKPNTELKHAKAITRIAQARYGGYEQTDVREEDPALRRSALWH